MIMTPNVVLSCGHRPLPQERFRPGSEHWCPTCCAWVPAEAGSLDERDVDQLVEQAESFLRHPAHVEERLGVDQGGAIGRCVGCGRWTDRASWCERCDA